MKGYTTREVAEVLGLPTSQILSWTRSGLVTPQRGPRGAYLFSFQDIVLLRTARQLLAEHVPPRRVRSALESLRAQLPVGRPLSAVHISARGNRVLVRDDETIWDPDSGQLQMDFAAADLAERPKPVATRALDGAHDQTTTADDWYNTALDLEGVAAARAVEAYERALELEPTHADALLNLGRLLHEDGELDAAEERYRAAAATKSGSGRPLYNLGVVLEDRGRTDDAVTAYRDALRADSDLAAAHFNLSRLLEAAGHKAEALSHLADYKRLLKRDEAAV